MEDNLVESYHAYSMSQRLVHMLEVEGSHTWDGVEEVMETFIDSLDDEDAYLEQNTYDFVEIVGLGILTDVLVWVMQDNSILIVGANNEDALKIGVLPPDTEFHPMPLDDRGRPVIVH